MGARSAKYCSKPPGEISSSTLVSSSVAFPKRVRHDTRLHHQLARAGLDHLVGDHGAHAPVEHERVLVLVAVPVDGRPERPRGERVLEDREPAFSAVAPQEVAVAEPREVGAVAVGGGDGRHAWLLSLNKV